VAGEFAVVTGTTVTTSSATIASEAPLPTAAAGEQADFGKLASKPAAVAELPQPPAVAIAPGAVVIDTQRRRRAPAAEAAAARPRTRQRGVLVLASGLFVLSLGAIAAFWGWQWYRGDVTALASTEQPTDEVRARLAAAGAKATPAVGTGDVEMPTGDDLEFPTAEAFGALSAASEPASALPPRRRRLPQPGPSVTTV